MATYLRCYGENLDVDLLLSQVDIEPSQVWRKGEKRRDKVHSHTGVSYCASDADMTEFDLQVEECVDFLNEFDSEVALMVATSGVEGVILDFGIELRDTFIHTDYLTPELLKVAGRLGIGIELSHYPVRKMTVISPINHSLLNAEM